MVQIPYGPEFFLGLISTIRSVVFIAARIANIRFFSAVYWHKFTALRMGTPSWCPCPPAWASLHKKRPWSNANICCLVWLQKWLVIDFEIANIHLNTFSNLSYAQGIKCHTIAHILQLSGVEWRKTEIINSSIFKIENSTMLKPFWRFQRSFFFRR